MSSLEMVRWPCSGTQGWSRMRTKTHDNHKKKGGVIFLGINRCQEMFGRIQQPQRNCLGECSLNFKYTRVPRGILHKTQPAASEPVSRA